MKNTLKNRLSRVSIPQDMQDRIIENCKKSKESEIYIMKKERNQIKFRKPLATAATLALCVCLTAVTAMAATGRLGRFLDITNESGAITGQVYENATEEIKLDITASADALTADITLLLADRAPYNFIDTIAIGEYTVTDAAGNTVLSGSTAPAQLADGCATVTLPLENLPQGHYKLTVTAFTCGAKAEQPLPIKGLWEYNFTK